MILKWYELRKIYDDGDSERCIIERFRYEDNNESMRNAKAKMIARVAIVRTITPSVTFAAFAMTREHLDWIV